MTSLFWLGVPETGDAEAVPVGAATVLDEDPVGPPLGLLGELENASGREFGIPVGVGVADGVEADGSII